MGVLAVLLLLLLTGVAATKEAVATGGWLSLVEEVLARVIGGVANDRPDNSHRNKLANVASRVRISSTP